MMSPSAATGSDSAYKLPLHDALSLGAISEGLESTNPQPLQVEVHRLPLLMRLLSSSRQFSSIPVWGEESSILETQDSTLQTTIDRLEDRAALYSIAEGVEVVACHLAPNVCRRIGKLSSLKKDNSGNYDVSPLEGVIMMPSNKIKRQKTGPSAGANDDSHLHHDDDGMDDTTMMDHDTVQATKLMSATDGTKRRRTTDRDSIAAVMGEDTLEGIVTKTLSELVSLVTESLKPDSKLYLSVDDSILAEPRQGGGKSGGGGGAVMGSDVCATVASCMYYSPVLQHRHVAVSSIYNYTSTALTF
jgi:hypothetical protein